MRSWTSMGLFRGDRDEDEDELDGHGTGMAWDC